MTMSKLSLICKKGIHGIQSENNKESEFIFDDLLSQSNETCCLLGARIRRALIEYESYCPYQSENAIDSAFRSYERSNSLKNRCRPAVIGRDAKECSWICDTQEQQKFRKKILPLAIGSHLMHWPMYQTTLHVYFHYQFVATKENSLLLTEADSCSGIMLPKTIIHNPFEYLNPINHPEDSSLKLFQFNLVAISSESFKTCEWQRTFLKELLEDGKWGVIGETHNFLIPFFLCPDRDTPDFVPEEVTRYSFVLNQHGQFVGDLALKLILPTVFSTNRHLIKHYAKLNERISHMEPPLPEKDITDFAMSLYDIYNTCHHLIIYSPLSTVIARHAQNHQLHNGIVEIIQSLSIASQSLMRLGAVQFLNVAIDSSGVAFSLTSQCKVDEKCKQYLRFGSVEALLHAGLNWIISSLVENFLDTEFVKDEVAMKAAVDFILTYFRVFLSDEELDWKTPNNTLTIYRFDPESNLYCKVRSNCDDELEKTRNLSSYTPLSSFAAQAQCMGNNIFRFSQYLIDYVPAKMLANEINSILAVSLRLCLYRLFPVRNAARSIERRDCLPVFPFLRSWTLSKNDHFGNPRPGWNNPFHPLFNILISSISYMTKSLNYENFPIVLPLYCEVVFQLFNPVTVLYDSTESFNKLSDDQYNCERLLKWAASIGHLMKRSNNIDFSHAHQKINFFPILQQYWVDFDISILEQLDAILRSAARDIIITKNVGDYGLLKFEGHLMSRGLKNVERLASFSYGDPIFEALHLQLPMLIFSPKGLNKYFFPLQYFAYCAYPLKNISTCNPQHTFYKTEQVSSVADHSNEPLQIESIEPNSLLNFEKGAQRSNVQLKSEEETAVAESIAPIPSIGWSSLSGLDSIAAISRSLRELLSISQGPNPVLQSSYNSSSSSISMLTSTSSMTSFSGDMVSNDYSVDRMSVTNEFNHLIVSSHPADLIDLVHREQRIGISQSATNII